MADTQFHEAAGIFPLMTGEDFDALVEDIRQHGLREEVKLLDGKILDGRNRYRACLLAKVECRCEEIDTDDPVAYVVSLNRHRRHMTPGQLAMAADVAREFYDVQAKERQKEHGKTAPGKGKNTGGTVTTSDSSKSRDAAGKALGVSGTLVDRARKVRKEGVPELAKAVEEGRMSLTQAAKLTSEEKEVQREAAKEAKATGGRYRNRMPKKGSNKRPEVRFPVSTAMQFADMAIDQLKRIKDDDPGREKAFVKVERWIQTNRSLS